MTEFTDQVVVISGAAGNLGAELAHRLAKLGAHLGLLDRRPGRLQEVCGNLADDPRYLLLGTVDMTRPESVQTAFSQVIDRFGRIDGLVNALGGYRAGTPLHETSLDDWNFMFELNVRSTFLACKAAVPHMLQAGRGKIVNVAARPGLHGIPNAAAYSAAKSAVIRLTESLSAELKHRGINVNCVLPGTLDTPENREQQPDADHAKWVTTSSVTEVILFLVSDQARVVHGAAIPAYGTS